MWCALFDQQFHLCLDIDGFLFVEVSARQLVTHSLDDLYSLLIQGFWMTAGFWRKEHNVNVFHPLFVNIGKTDTTNAGVYLVDKNKKYLMGTFNKPNYRKTITYTEPLQSTNWVSSPTDFHTLDHPDSKKVRYRVKLQGPHVHWQNFPVISTEDLLPGWKFNDMCSQWGHLVSRKTLNPYQLANHQNTQSPGSVSLMIADSHFDLPIA